jgi:membrane-bound metal-dependent hydrolase YbcI (DUF457 family)
MPSPVGHALGGAILGAALGTLGTRGIVVPVVAAMAPDLDFLWGRHSMETHSVGAAIIAGLVVFAWRRNARLAVVTTLAVLSHVLFDWLGSDDTPPLGVMALWPFSSNFYFANAFIFEAISRRYWLDNFFTHNAWAVTKEILMLGPLVFIAFLWRARRRFRLRGTT